MSHKKEYSGNNIISVYQFMEMCGLNCEKRNNILISHKAMIRKLRLRNMEFPEEVEMPVGISFQRINKEDVEKGKVLLVEDDYEKLCPYRKPVRLNFSLFNKTKEELELIRKELISKIEASHNEEDSVLKPGEMKYLWRHSQKKKREEELYLESMIDEDSSFIEESVTEKQHRLVKVQKRNYY